MSAYAVLKANNTISGVARMSKLCGHSMGTFSVPNTHLLRELGHAPTIKTYLKSTL